MDESAVAYGDERGLLRRLVQSGDAEAFGAIAHLHAGMVYGTCLRITGNPELAADASQDTFLQLLRQADRIAGSLAAWLHRVAARRAIDLVRRDAARRRREETYAAMPRETDQWADIAPLVDEALDELDAESRDLLVRHYLQGQTTSAIAAAKDVSQPTISRRIEEARDQLRGRLRAKGVLVAGVALVALLPQTITTAPAAVVSELGKMALAAAGSAVGSGVSAAWSGIQVKLALAAVLAAVGVGGYLVYQSQSRVVPPAGNPPPVRPTGRPTAGPRPNPPQAGAATIPIAPPPPSAPAAAAAAPAPAPGQGGQSQPQGFGGLMGRGATVVATPPLPAMGFGGFGPGTAGNQPAPPMATPEGAVRSFVSALAGGDVAKVEGCFLAGSPDLAGLRRLLEKPQTDEERNMKQCLESLGLPVQIVDTSELENGLRVKWKATVSKPISVVQDGVASSWQKGDWFELEVRLERVENEWRVAGF